MSFSQRQEAVQKLSAEQRQAQRQELTMQMAMDLTDQFDGGAASPDRMYEHVIGNLISQCQVELQQAMRGYALNTHVKATALKNPLVFAHENYDQILDVAGRSFFDMFQGSFALESPQTGKVQHVNVHQGRFMMALTEPEQLERDIADTSRLISTDSGREKHTGVGTMQNLAEMEHARVVISALGEHIHSLRNILVALLHHGDGGDRPLRDFFRNMLVIRRLMPVISERMQKRFATRAMQMNARTSSNEMKLPVLNAVGEYALASLGIISADLFDLRSGHVDEASVQEAREILANDGIDLDQIMRKYQLKTEGNLFWYRWAVRHQKPNYETDEAVRTFITETLREDSDAILEAVHYDDVFKKMQTIVLGCSTNVEDRKNAHDALRELLVDTFSEETFRELMRTLMSKKWYDKLLEYMSVDPEESKQ